jgi:RNA polymerase sigma factor (sigma-70 family)
MTTVTPAIEDAVLLRTYAARGDAAAFAELVRRYADLVYATARRVTGSSATAEDVAQDCFLSLAMHSGGIRGSVAAWLHRTTLNRSLELLRSERARKQREAAVAAATAAIAASAVTTTTMTTSSESAQLIAHVDEAIASLPEELRVAVTEHFLCGRSQVDLAAAMGVNQSTISRRIDTGLRRLRDRLNERGVTGVALAAFGVLLSDLLRGDAAAAGVAPGAVRAGLTKIGLAGVRSTSSAASGMGALTKAAAALLLLLAAAGGVIALAMWQTPSRPTRQVVVPAAAAAASTAPSTRASDDDDDDDDDKQDDHQDEVGKVSNSQTR